MSFPSTMRLFVRFALAGLIGFILIAFLLFQVWMRNHEQHIINETKGTTARYINAILGHLLEEKDFEGVKRGSDWDRFQERISDLFSLPEIVRVKIYDRKGELIWSDAVALLDLAPAAKKNPELLEALEGHVQAEVSSLEKEEHRFERGPFRSLMELYVPISFRQSDKPVGVAEVYLNIDPLMASIRDTAWLVALTIVGGLALLLAISYLGLGRAVAMIHKQNRDLQTSLEEIFKANREKHEIVSSLRHEVRKPDAIMSYAGLLMDGALGDLPQKLKPSIEQLRNTAAEILSQFTRMLELTRLKVGDVIPKKEMVDLSQLLRDITSDLRLFCGNGAVVMNLDLPSEEVLVNSDRHLLQQVIIDLVMNAIKCTPKGHITVRLEQDPDRDGVKVAVEDTGVGIKPQELPRVFDEFYRGNDPNARFKSGVGLGLSIVKRSLELLHGEIAVESTYGKGSRFTILLPKSV